MEKSSGKENPSTEAEKEGGEDHLEGDFIQGAIFSTALAVLFTLVDSGIDRCSIGPRR